MSYREQRDYENLQRAYFLGEGEYDIPILGKVSELECENWIGFNFARGCEEPKQHGVHFFVDDYQFVRVWRDPDRYIPMLQKFKAVCTPDFSTYTDFPKAVQVFNHYRKHWCGAYWQMHGITVIPTISWADQDSFDWCFDGEPVGGIVAVSSVGTQADQQTKGLFLAGYREMLSRLKPTGIIFYGAVPEGCTGNIMPIQAFQQKWRNKDNEFDRRQKI